jgi:hypothetical protein
MLETTVCPPGGHAGNPPELPEMSTVKQISPEIPPFSPENRGIRREGRFPFTASPAGEQQENRIRDKGNNQKI